MQNRGRPLKTKFLLVSVSACIASFASSVTTEKKKRLFDSFIPSLACPTFRPGCEGSAPNPFHSLPPSRSKNHSVPRALRSQVSYGFIIAAIRNGRRIRNRSSLLLFDLVFVSTPVPVELQCIRLTACLERYFGPCDSFPVDFFFVPFDLFSVHFRLIDRLSILSTLRFSVRYTTASELVGLCLLISTKRPTQNLPRHICRCRQHRRILQLLLSNSHL